MMEIVVSKHMTILNELQHTLYSRAGFGQQIHGTTSELAMHYEKDGASANGTKLVNDLLNDFIRSKTQKVHICLFLYKI